MVKPKIAVLGINPHNGDNGVIGNEDDEVLILEAMKMELPVVATSSGTVKDVNCNSGDTVEADAVLITLE